MHPLSGAPFQHHRGQKLWPLHADSVNIGQVFKGPEPGLFPQSPRAELSTHRRQHRQQFPALRGFAAQARILASMPEDVDGDPAKPRFSNPAPHISR
eukprot:14153470-Alexandrium_andersonii.AAC.1